MSVRVAISQDWMVGYTGSERVVEQLLDMYPGSRFMTAVFAPWRLPPTLQGAEPSFLQRVPGAVDHHHYLLPLLPLSWRVRPPVEGVDAVISSSHSCARAVRHAEGLPHVCYCHTPMRYAWDFHAEKKRLPAPLRPIAQASMGGFRRWDRATSEKVTLFLANSTAVAERIRRAYGRESRVVPPPVDTDRFTPKGERGDEFLYVGRLVSYKRPDLVVEAFRGLPYRVRIAGEGHMAEQLRARAPDNVELLGHVDDARLVELYRSSRALVYPAEEDFGIVMAEAQACGTPVISIDRGGARDIVEHGRTGWLAPDGSVEQLRRAVREAATADLDPADVAASAQRFSVRRFRESMRQAVDEAISAGSRRVTP